MLANSYIGPLFLCIVNQTFIKRVTFTFATSNHFVILATASHIVIFAAFSHFVPDPKMHSEWVYILGHFAQVRCFSQLLSFRLGEFCKHHPPAATLVSSPWFT